MGAAFAVRSFIAWVAVGCLGLVWAGEAPAACFEATHEGAPYSFCNDALPWSSARSACLTAGRDLVTIDSAAENAFVASTAASFGLHAASNTVWMGLDDLALEGTFVWASGAPVSFTSWGPGEPNDASGGEDCGEIFMVGAVGAWNDLFCTFPRPYVCEGQPPTTTTTTATTTTVTTTSSTSSTTSTTGTTTTTQPPCGNGAVDVGEQCDDGAANGAAGSCCTVGCQALPAGTACEDEGELCTADRCDGTGACLHASAPAPACAEPLVAGGAALKIVSKATPSLDQVKLKWGKGPVVPKADFGAPGTTTAYQLCVYQGAGTLVYAGRPDGGLCGAVPCWKALSTGWKFTSKTGAPDGVTGVKLKEGLAPLKAKLQVKAKGDLALATLPLAPNVVAQLRTSDGRCWGATFSAPKKNDAKQFSAKSNLTTTTTATTTTQTSTTSTTVTTSTTTPTSTTSTTNPIDWQTAVPGPELSVLRDGRLLVTNYGGQGRLLDSATGAILETIPVPDVRNGIWSPPFDARDLIVGGYEGRQAYWTDGELEWTFAPIGCCNVPRLPFAIDHVLGMGYFAANGGLYGFDLASGAQVATSSAGLGFGWVSVVDSTVLYTAGSTGAVSRLESATPNAWTTAWSAPIDAGAYLGPPAITAAGGVVVGSIGEHLADSSSWYMSPGRLAHVASDGTVLWNIAPNTVTPPVLGATGLVYVGTQVPNLNPGGPGGLALGGPGTIDAYDLATGALAWSTPVAGLPTDVLVADDGRVYAVTANARLLGLDAATGAPALSVTLPGSDLRTQAILHAGRVYVAANGVVAAIPVPATGYEPASSWPVRFHDNRHTANVGGGS